MTKQGLTAGQTSPPHRAESTSSQRMCCGALKPAIYRPYMSIRTSRALLLTAFKTPTLGVCSTSIRRHLAANPRQQVTHQKRTMASATSFYDFQPKDSTQPLQLHHPKTKTNDPSPRNRRPLPPPPPQRQSHPPRQHRFKMRLHPTARGPRNPL